MKLAWPDLLVEDITPEEFEQWIGHWSGVVSGRVAPAFLNRFGVWFLRRPEGPVDMLDVFSGEPARLGGPNPMAGDAVAVDQVMVMDIGAWQSLCAQVLGGRA